MSNGHLKTIVKASFHELLENPHFDPNLIPKFFSKNYIQHVDGKTLDYDGFTKHAENLRTRVSGIKITFEHLIEEGDKVCSVHIAESIRDGKKVKAKVIAMFQFKDDKIILCDELTYLIAGDESDRDLGSA